MNKEWLLAANETLRIYLGSTFEHAVKGKILVDIICSSTAISDARKAKHLYELIYDMVIDFIILGYYGDAIDIIEEFNVYIRKVES